MLASRYRHVIWDWNGTLLDDVDLCIDVINGVLRSRALPALNRTRYHEVFGFPVRDYYTRLGFDTSPASFHQLSVEFIAGYEARRREAKLHEGVERILAAVTAAGVTQSILSAYRQETLQEVVAEFGLMPHFVRLTGLDNIYAHSKADRGRAWLAELGLPPSEVLMIGDTLHDIEVARELGIDCELVAHGHHRAERLRRHSNRVSADVAGVAAVLGISLSARPAEAVGIAGSGNPAGSRSQHGNR